MDFLNSKLIAAIGNLQRAVFSLKQSIDASRNQQERHNQQQQAQWELPPPRIKVEAEIHERPDHSGKKKPTSERQLTVQWVIAVGTWCAFAAAGIYAGLAARQLHTLNRQTKLMQTENGMLEKHFRTDERPFIKVEAEGGQGHAIKFNPNSPIHVPVTVENLGKTPALHLKGEMYIALFRLSDNNPKGARIPGPIYKVSSGIMYQQSRPLEIDAALYEPGANGRYEPVKFSGDIMKDMLRGDRYLETWGEISYSDPFGTPHWTRFCLLLSPQPLGMGYTMPKYNDQQNRCSEANSVDAN